MDNNFRKLLYVVWAVCLGHNNRLLIAHLAYNFRSRIELLIARTPDAMKNLIEEDILNAIECVDYLADQVGVMQETSQHYHMWKQVKEDMYKVLITREANWSDSCVAHTLMEIGKSILMELDVKFELTLSQIFLHSYAIGLVVSHILGGNTLEPDIAMLYIRASSNIPFGYFSQRYTRSVDNVNTLLIQLVEKGLDVSELNTVCDITAWQSQFFIFHVVFVEDDSAVGAGPSQQHLYECIHREVQVDAQAHNEKPFHSVVAPIALQQSQQAEIEVPEITTDSVSDVNKAGEKADQEENENQYQRLPVSLLPDQLHQSHAVESLDVVAMNGLYKNTVEVQSDLALDASRNVDESGLVQNGVARSLSIAALRQQLQHSESAADFKQQMSRVNEFIDDVDKTCTQLTRDLKELHDALSIISSSVVTEVLEETVIEKRQQLAEDRSALHSLFQLRQEMAGHQRMLVVASLSSVSVAFGQQKLGEILESARTDQMVLGKLTACAIDMIPVQMVESLCCELASFDYLHPVNKFCQQTLVMKLSKRLTDN